MSLSEARRRSPQQRVASYTIHAAEAVFCGEPPARDFGPKHDERMTMTKTLKEGEPAPDFDLPTDGGGRFKLGATRGKAVVVYFYPKDDTSGCTKEAIDF